MARLLDLRHVISPAVRDLVELANLGDLDRVVEQVRAMRGCARPVNLRGWTVTTDTTTDTIVRSYTTDDEPTGRLLTPCGNRRASRCPACSRVYAADTYHLIKAGLSGGKNVPEAVRSHPRVFVTLTAPSFGHVHGIRTTSAGRVLDCPCGRRHREDDPVLGTPLDPATYDYTGAVLWNAHAGALWARFTIYLRRKLAKRLGLTMKQFNAALRVSFAKVAEYQKRGLVHFHAVIRLDGPDGHTTAPPARATADMLTKAIRDAVKDTEITVESDTVGDHTIKWGKRLDIREITALGDGELTDNKVAAYVAKYATKSAVEDSGTIDRTLVCRPCAGQGYTTGPDRFRDLCDHCEGTGQAEPLPELRVRQHVRQMIRTAWALGHLPEFAGLKLWKWAHMLGFRGHFSTKSRAYSTTLTALRDVRRAWRLAQARADDGRDLTDEDTTLVTDSSWTYLASGYRPGEELLAAQTRHDLEEADRIKTEGVPWL
ncbi:replication initiator [Streptomyces sp. HK10]|uniref:replication initiator n=1 Tax=Streptomyces sp. HK10 TaxID=3373255 RepID=UPI00374793B9